MRDLDARARDAGIAPSFRDYFGNDVIVGDATKRALLAAIGNAIEETDALLPPAMVVREGSPVRVPWRPPSRLEIAWEVELERGGSRCGRALPRAGAVSIAATPPLGYHRLTVRDGEGTAACALIVVPRRCFLQPELERGRMWALGTQLYGLRSQRDWGIGDFSSLAELAKHAAAAGCDAIGLNPLHALHSANPLACSPYAPSSRLFLNALYIDVESVADLAESAQAASLVASSSFQKSLRAARASGFVDYPRVAQLKHSALTLSYESFARHHLERAGDARARRFRRFVRDGGRALEQLALYEALDEYFRALPEPRYGWERWPDEFHAPLGDAVRDFATRHRARVEYYAYLQWLAEEQLARAARTAARYGVGLYRDLAVGVDRYGADAWGNQDLLLAATSLGAPPDPLNVAGQSWGLPASSPSGLRGCAYAPFVQLLRANMRHAVVLRIDHVMALARTFWIPRDRPAGEGAYVSYDFDAMLGIVALESVRNRCAVVGEDLGTVPDGFRERLRDANALSSRLIYFERDANGAFLPPEIYPRLAAASLGTHDLPPLAGWWLGTDPGADGGAEDRERARFALIDALERCGAAAPPCARRLRDDAAAGATAAVLPELSDAVHRFLAATPSVLRVVAIEDVLGETGAVNVPGTVDDHPNWRRRRSVPLDAIESDGRLFRIGAIMCDTEAAMRQTERR